MLESLFNKVLGLKAYNFVNSFMTEAVSYRNQSTDLLHISMDWFLYDNDLRHERVKKKLELVNIARFKNTFCLQIYDTWLGVYEAYYKPCQTSKWGVLRVQLTDFSRYLRCFTRFLICLSQYRVTKSRLESADTLCILNVPYFRIQFKKQDKFNPIYKMRT